MSPGSVTEVLFFFIGANSKEMKVSESGRVDLEEENIEVLEMPFFKAFGMNGQGEIKDVKTIILPQHLKLK